MGARAVDTSVQAAWVPVVAIGFRLTAGALSLAPQDEPRAGRVDEFPPPARLEHDRVGGALARLAEPGRGTGAERIVGAAELRQPTETEGAHAVACLIEIADTLVLT